MAGSVSRVSNDDVKELSVGDPNTVDFIVEDSSNDELEISSSDEDIGSGKSEDSHDSDSQSLNNESSPSDDDSERLVRNASDKICTRTQEWQDISVSESDASSSDDEVSNPTPQSNVGWAKAMQKILSTEKPSGKKSIILSKADKLSKVLAVQKANEESGKPDFEIVGESEVKEEKPDIKDFDIKPKHLTLVEKKVKPSFLNREKERRLNKIATKGIVQLFNAVRNQQKEIKKKMNSAGGRFRKEEKVLKSLDKHSFVNMLMGSSESTSVKENIKKEIKSENSSEWNVLQDNFMSGGSLKDWDKKDKSKDEVIDVM